jgi:hypothetical protein
MKMIKTQYIFVIAALMFCLFSSPTQAGGSQGYQEITAIFIDSDGNTPSGCVCFTLADGSKCYVMESAQSGKQLIAFVYMAYTNKTKVSITFNDTQVIAGYKRVQQIYSM